MSINRTKNAHGHLAVNEENQARVSPPLDFGHEAPAGGFEELLREHQLKRRNHEKEPT